MGEVSWIGLFVLEGKRAERRAVAVMHVIRHSSSSCSSEASASFTWRGLAFVWSVLKKTHSENHVVFFSGRSLDCKVASM